MCVTAYPPGTLRPLAPWLSMLTMKSQTYPETVSAMHEHLRARLAGVVPDFELRAKAALAVEVNALKREKRAIILGHNYMEPALFHSVPDFTGDSLHLARMAASAEAEVIVFCGVRFMAETAKILNPSRLVLLPSPKGGCSLASSLTAQDVLRLRAAYPDAPVVTYVNTYADVKAESDYCCTSGNAAAVVHHLREKGHEHIIFLPDEYLAANVAREAQMRYLVARGDDLPQPQQGEPTIIGWGGRCEVHEKFSVEDVQAVRRQFQDVVILTHPECRPDVVEASDFSGSTSDMIRYIEKMERGRYLLLTECSMADNIVSRTPGRDMLRLCSMRCPHMAEISLEQTIESLKQERYAVDVEEGLRLRAHRAVERMIGIG
jgi:quinolinate synthase